LNDPQFKRDMGDDTDPRQIVYWMRDLTQIVLLDFILSQPDRVGNIDYVERWYWIENGEMKSRKAVSHGDEAEPLPEGAVRLKRTYLNDIPPAGGWNTPTSPNPPACRTPSSTTLRRFTASF
jgi:hypothetical protein